MKYDLNKDASDVIIHISLGDTYKNMMTGKEGSLEEVVTDNHFLIFKSQYDIRGYRTFLNRNKLVYIKAKFIKDKDGCKWEPESKLVIKKSAINNFFCAIEMSDNSCYRYSLKIKNLDDILDYNSVADICGQAVMRRGRYSNKASEAKKDMLSFFGHTKIRLRADRPLYGDSMSFYEPNDDIRTLVRASNRTATATIVKKCVKESMPIAREADEIMKKYVRECIKKEYDVRTRVSYIHKRGNKCYLRVFSPIVEWKHPAEKSFIDFLEIARIPLKKQDFITTTSNDFNSIILYMDDIKDTELKYVGYPIKNWIDRVNKCIENQEDFLENIKEEFTNYELKYGYPPEKSAFISLLLINMPEVEKLFNIKSEQQAFIRYNVSQLLCEGHMMVCDIKRQFEEKFGKINGSKNSLNAIYGVPKGFIELSAQKKILSAIKDAKDIFGFSEEGEKYLVSINHEESQFLFNFIKNNKKSFLWATQKNTMKNLIILYGFKKWKSFANHLSSLSQSGEILNFCQFVRMLLVIGEPAKKMDWKLSGEALLVKMDALKAAYEYSEDKAKIVLSDRMFKARKAELEKYVYCDNEYIIKYPENCSEIVNEGCALHHCVADFISKAANGYTTILFIRRKKEPDKPYYTLEIRNNTIQQCHGFDNRNINRSLESFLKKYCKKKGITFDRGDRLYGANN